MHWVPATASSQLLASCNGGRGWSATDNFAGDLLRVVFFCFFGKEGRVVVREVLHPH